MNLAYAEITSKKCKMSYSSYVFIVVDFSKAAHLLNLLFSPPGRLTFLLGILVDGEKVKLMYFTSVMNQKIQLTPPHPSYINALALIKNHYCKKFDTVTLYNPIFSPFLQFLQYLRLAFITGMYFVNIPNQVVNFFFVK